MALSPGAAVGPYRIVGPLGAGGMGLVYRAEDTKLKREVAIKVLPDLAAHDEPRVRRFEREAHVLASLNHPHIAAIYGLEQADGAMALVLELVEGPTLAERIASGAIPVEEALGIARQVAQALEAAHEKGIVHRDLKPANVKLTAEGEVKVLDFGLAKEIEDAGSTEPSLSHSPTMARPTETGVILGTAGYMSPEQARGKKVDKRADIWAFGVVLYEMLAGAPLFRGETVSDVLAAVLTRDPDWSRLPKETPSSVRRLLGRLLERDPKRRLRDIGDALPDLQRGEAVERGRSAAPRSPLAWIAVALLAAVLGSVIAYVAAPSTGDGPQPSFRALTFRRGSVFNARFSPDGASVLYAASWGGTPPQVFSSRLDAPESTALDVRSRHIVGVASGEVAFIQENGTLSRLPIGAGIPRDVLEGVIDADWPVEGSDFAVVRREGGRTRLEFPPGTTLFETVGDVFYPRVSPSGDKVAFTHHPSAGHTQGVATIVDASGRTVASSDTYGLIGGVAWHGDGEVWFSGGRAAEGTSIRSLSLSGRSRDVLKAPGFLSLHDIDRDGRLLITHDTQTLETAALAPGETTERDLSWFDRTALEDLTPDGRFLVFHEWGFGGKLTSDDGAAFLRGTNGSAPARLAAGSPLALSPDGRWAIVNHDFEGKPSTITLFPTGAGDPKPLPAGTIRRYYDAWWFPDGKRILLSGNEGDRPRRLFVQEISGGEPKALTPEGVVALENSISPDGKWVAAGAYGEAMSLYPIEEGERRSIPGLSPDEYVLRWTPDGRHLFVTARDLEKIPARILRLDLESGHREEWKELSPADSAGVQNLVWLCLTPDGRSYAYSYFRRLSVLYLVSNVR